jgi:protein translocase SecG subunit
MLTPLVVLQGILVLSMTLLVLLQKSSADGMANLAGGATKSMHASMQMDFIKKGTIFLAVAFISNSLLIANISYHKNNLLSISDYIKTEESTGIISDDE